MALQTEIFDYIVMTPAGAPDATLAIAGSRAGAIGIVNLEFARDLAEISPVLDRMFHLGRNRRGVLVDGDSFGLLTSLLENDRWSFDVVMITTPSQPTLTSAIARVHDRGAKAYVVVTSPGEADEAEVAGADAIVAKGHEAGGWVGDETTFVLIQRLLGRISVPLWAYGGIGLHTAAACFAVGVSGVVLDSQLLLTRETPLPDDVMARLRTMDGSETAAFGTALGRTVRTYNRPGLPICDEIRGIEVAATIAGGEQSNVLASWRDAVSSRIGWRDVERELFLVGQDATFAEGLARRFGTVGGVIGAFRQSVEESISQARNSKALDPGSPLSASHGTTYPIVQGPMTRVSDRAEFALAVAEGGALPFLALALMRAPEAEALLLDTQRQLGARPWGVGILGFVPPELRAEQLDVIRRIRPPYALIAGGRPDQSRALENEGIPTYLHVPSPGLLSMFTEEGARRFVFEGRECGGHVGPRTSFVLWNSMIDVLLAKLKPGAGNGDYHVLFAGGIHDATSAAMVGAMSAPLTARGVRVGVLIGTAYLFTSEAVESGAIVPEFQHAAVTCSETVLLESGPGHATRCVPSPFVDDFNREKRALLQAGLASEEVRGKLEDLNVGRLRIASKGVDRNPEFGKNSDAPRLVPVTLDDQHRHGMYMIGQVAVMRDQVGNISELHRDISVGSTNLLESSPRPSVATSPKGPPAAVAIVGMGCILPGAPDLSSYWANILNKVDAVTEVPPDRWDWRQYYDPDKSAPDKVYSKWGGFLADVPFDPLEFGMPPNTLSSIEPFQLLALLVVRDALRDAGLADRPFPRERTSVILGAGGGSGDLTVGYTVRSTLPSLVGDSAPALIDRLSDSLPEWTEDSFAGFLLNVAAGRVANRLDFGGVNFTVDAACASSLAAVYQGVRELESGSSDVVVVGGVDAIQNPFSFTAFSKTQALSPTGRCRTFDAKADGIAISEGFAALVLKRLDDAERDGDRIYAVIRGVGGSSDGRDRSLTAPRPEGQIRALRRAYDQAGYSPSTVELIEAHGTGTVAGDQAEVQALTRFFVESGAGVQRTGIGSVKSMIGHTKATAGVAGLIKVAMSLHRRVLPPTLGVTEPNPKANFSASPFYVNSESRPWIHAETVIPRRAGVSAFGFGGTNFHVAVEEYTNEAVAVRDAAQATWPAELFLWRQSSRQALRQNLAELCDQLVSGARPNLGDLSFSVAKRWLADAKSRDVKNRAVSTHQRANDFRIALVATSIDDLVEKLGVADKILEGTSDRHHDARGVHFATNGHAVAGQVAFLFPGQGSQYVNMLRDLAVAFPEARETFELGDRVLADRLPKPLSSFIFPPPAFAAEVEKKQLAELTETDVAQAALGASDLAMYRVLSALNVDADMVAGHSYGEFVALAVAGCFDDETLLTLSEARGRFIREGSGTDAGCMAAVDAGAEELRPLLAEIDVTLSNMNAPKQTVISGSRAGIEAAMARCTEAGLRPKLLPVACAFHSPLVAAAQQRLAELLRQTSVTSPRRIVYSNTTGGVYPSDPAAIVDLLADHLVRPVEFVREITAMHDAGARVFVEVGPKSVLSGLASRILADKPHLAVSFDQSGRPGIVQLLNGVASLAVEGIDVDPRRLYQGRARQSLNLSHLTRDTASKPHSPTTWLVNGGRAIPAAKAAVAKIKSPVSVILRDSGSRSEPEAPITAPVSTKDSVDVMQQSTTYADAPRGKHVKTLIDSGQVDVLVNGTSNGHRPAEIPQTLPDSRSGILVDGANDVMRQFQTVMQRFLETQQNVMLAFLRSDASTSLQPMRVPKAQLASSVSPANGGYSAAAQVVQPLQSRVVGAAPMKPGPSIPSGSTQQLSGNELSTPTNGTNGVSHKMPVPPHQNGASVVAKAAIVEPAAKPADGMTASQISDLLLGIVSERTGYPSEMLGLDADLEADLGIDSIKRVEIVGSVVRALRLSSDKKIDLEPLTGSRTLRSLIAKLVEVTVPPSSASSAREGDQRPFDSAPSGSTVSRFLLRSVTALPANANGTLSRSGVVLVTDDELGIGQELGGRLVEAGYRVVRCISIQSTAVGQASVLAANLGNADGVAKLVDEVHQKFGPVAAIVHLAPLRPGLSEIGFDRDAWRARLSTDLESLFLLTKALATDLESSASQGGSAVLATVNLGGDFATSGTSPFFPGHGSISGYLKSLAQELPGVRVRTVDVGGPSLGTTVPQIWSELFSGDGYVEVGYRNSERIALRLVETVLPDNRTELPLDDRSVILITGGARGITAEVAAQLVQHVQPTLILVGRTPLVPSDSEAPEFARVVEPLALRRLILERRRRANEPVTPRAVEGEYLALVRGREVSRNLEILRATGARVEYHDCDVGNADTFGALIDKLYATHGRIDGVIHGAGVIEDKLIQDKTLESFERVIRTKVDGALVLATKLRPESLRFVVFFSSIAGRLGNRGQSDYAAANEIMNKLAQNLARTWSRRVVAINWGPWATLGMATPEIQRQFAERGMAVVPVDVGRRMFVAEVARGGIGDVEVVVAGGSAVANVDASGLSSWGRPASRHA